LTDNLVVEGGAGKLDERVAIRELDWDGHGREDLNGFGGCLVEVPSRAAESWDLESLTSILAADWRTSILLCKWGFEIIHLRLSFGGKTEGLGRVKTTI
jgi:hypothetical protein